jgi:organic hydroperoxide reductase OsmC/OhrA
MMKVAIRNARMHVRTKFEAHGSVLAQTVSSSCQGVTYRLEVESDESPERIAGLIRNAENGCFAMSAIKEPVEVRGELLLNGNAIDLAAYPPPKKEG